MASYPQVDKAATPGAVDAALELAESLGDRQGWYSRKACREIRERYEAGAPIACVEVEQLLGLYAQDNAIGKDTVTPSALIGGE